MSKALVLCNEAYIDTPMSEGPKDLIPTKTQSEMDRFDLISSPDLPTTLAWLTILL